MDDALSDALVKATQVNSTNLESTTKLQLKVDHRNLRGQTPLHIAAVKGDHTMCMDLIKEEADVDSVDYAGCTPLHEACNYGWYDTAVALVKQGANFNACAAHGNTPLHDASSNGHYKIARMLVRHGADVFKMNRSGQSPIDVAIDYVMITILKTENGSDNKSLMLTNSNEHPDTEEEDMIASIDKLPEEVLIEIVSYIDAIERCTLELVSKRWRNILSSKKMRRIHIDLDSLMQHPRKLPVVINSLVVNKGKIIEGIEVSIPKNTKLHKYYKSALEDKIITRGVNNTLKRLRIVGDGIYGMFNWNGFNPLINLSVNLQHLELRCQSDKQPEVNLFNLTNLKQLIGRNVHFINCCAINLVKLKYWSVDMDTTDDLVQMLLVVADSIEELILFHITIHNELNDQIVIKMPKLTKLNLNHDNNFNFTIDLAESNKLQYIDVRNYDSDIIHFDLSVHCLTEFNCDTHLFTQFIKSVKLHRERLCLLESLLVDLSPSQFNDLVSCFSTSYVYSLRQLHIFLDNESSRDPLINSNIVNLVKSCSNLVEVSLPCSIDKQRLIDLIMNKVYGKFELLIDSISNCTEIEFLNDLYSALSDLNPRPVKRPGQKVVIDCNMSTDHAGMKKKMNKFGVYIR